MGHKNYRQEEKIVVRRYLRTEFAEERVIERERKRVLEGGKKVLEGKSTYE